MTGTNGKTTVTYLLDAGLRGAGQTTGLVGTVETRIAGRAVPSVRTTPEAPDLQGLFAAMLEQHVSSASMEVSSHALALHRVDGCRFAGAAFTNLSQDHLDFHPTMEDYFEAKALLFDPERSAVAVVDVDDAYGRRLLERRPDAIPVSSQGDPGLPGAWWAGDVVTGPTSSSFTLHGPNGRRLPVQVPLPGAFNVANTVVALGRSSTLPLVLDSTEPAGDPGRPGDGRRPLGDQLGQLRGRRRPGVAVRPRHAGHQGARRGRGRDVHRRGGPGAYGRAQGRRRGAHHRRPRRQVGHEGRGHHRRHPHVHDRHGPGGVPRRRAPRRSRRSAS